MTDDRAELRLSHILESIELIQRYVTGLEREDFLDSPEKQDAIMRRLEVIGEAVRHISPELRARYPDIRWRSIAGTRDRLIHKYETVDLDLTWQIIHRDLPELKRQVTRILTEIEKPEAPQT